MTQRETTVVQQFVAGTLPLDVFVRLLHRDGPLRQYLASGGGLEAYAQADLLGQLVRTGWQDVAAVRRAQQLLERFLGDQGVAVDPAGLYQERVDFLERSRSLLTELQPAWLRIPVPYFALMLDKCGDQADGDLEELMRRQIERRFRFLEHPPRWLHDEYWPVGRHGPLVFVAQVDVDPGTAVNYVFVDPQDGAFLVLPQTRPQPAGQAPPPESPDVRLPRGVVPVHARPGAFWLPPSGARRRLVPGEPGEPARDDGPTAEPVDGDATSGAPPAQPQPSVSPVVSAPPGSTSPSVDQPVVDPQPAVDRPSGQTPVVEPAAVQPAVAPAVSGPAAPATEPLDPPGEPAPVPAGEGGSGQVVTLDLSFQPWTLALTDGRTFKVESRLVVVGRRPQTDEPGAQVLTIADSSRALSKTHARLELIDDTWYVTDLGSTNGVVITTADGQETKAEPGQPAPVYSYVAFGSVEARLQPDAAG